MCFKYMKVCLKCKTSYELRHSMVNKCAYQSCDTVYLKSIYIHDHECEKCIQKMIEMIDMKCANQNE